MHETIIYCDGSSIGNPGPGGWGAVISNGMKVKELGGFDTKTTNNRMELTATIESLKNLKGGTKATLHTDSRYVIHGITQWVHGWSKNGWQTKEKKEVLNKDLWQELEKVTKKHSIRWEHVRGHAGILLNERVDMIANGFARRNETKLFSGSETKYVEFLKSMPKARIVSKSSSKKKKTGPAYSYVSCIEGKVLTHKTWGECEKRVKGKKAQFKKVFSIDEEHALVREWGTM